MGGETSQIGRPEEFQNTIGKDDGTLSTPEVRGLTLVMLPKCRAVQRLSGNHFVN
jgi:hypothetical protein